MPRARFPVALLTLLLLPAAPGPVSAQEVGTPWQGAPGVTLTVGELQEREARAPRPTGVRPTKPEIELREILSRRENPEAPSLSQWPPAQAGPQGALPPPTTAAQALSTSFTGISLGESGFIPPDSMGAVGPTQVVVAGNGRIKVFSKAGALGGLNVSTNIFFSAVRGGVDVSDPHVRYDRLSGRWFVSAITVSTPNRILLAVSSGPTITNEGTFTFFFFRQDLVGPTPNSDTGGLADYDTLGVDRSALYIGVNVFNLSGPQPTLAGTTGFVVRKADLLSGVLTVTAFRQMGTAFAAGPLTPQGVDNDDPGATQGFFIGPDTTVESRLVLRRVSNPGGTPALSGNLFLNVPTTAQPIRQVHLGSAFRLDALDSRLFAAHIKKNRLTGTIALFTAHNIEVNASGVGQAGGGRNGSRWYEIRNLAGTPTLAQAGTLFDSAFSDPFGYWIPSVAASGQGHMALGASRASSSTYAGIVVAGRLASDPLGALQAPVVAVDGVAGYNTETTAPQRWGDYSQTVVDPVDDMTLWTFQQFTHSSSPVDSWAVRAIRLQAPPPATPACPTPVLVTATTQSVVIGGTSSGGSAFFDPGPDAGGPGFARRLSASVSGGSTVNSVTFDSPTQVTVNVTVTSPGLKNLVITNPDGQSVSGTGCLNVGVDLRITKTDGQTAAVPGQPLTYTLVVQNVGPTDVGASVSDVFPAALSSVSWSCTATAGSLCGATTGAGNIAEAVVLKVGGTVTYAVSALVDPAARGSLSNTAMVAAASGSELTPADNTATDTDTLVPQANLGITKTDGQTTAVPGGSIAYTVAATNAGPSSITGAQVTDTFPATLTGVTWSCTASAGSLCGATTGAGNIAEAVSLSVGGTVIYTINALVDPAARGSLSNTATISGGPVSDPAPANNSATDSDTLVPQANLGITKTDGQTTAIPGSSIAYTVAASNAGPSSVTGGLVTDTFPATLTGVTWTCTASPGSACGALSGSGNLSEAVALAVGGTVTYAISATINIGASSSLSNTATVSGSPVSDPVPANNSATDTDTLLPPSDLSVTKTDGRDDARAGEALTYTIVAANAGPQPLTGALVTDTVPSGLGGAAWTCVGAGGGVCPASGAGSFSHTVDLPVGATATYTLTGTVVSAPATLRNTVTIAVPAGRGDPFPANNSATDDDVLVCGNEAALIGDGQRTAPVAVPAGGEVWFLLTVRAGSSYSLEAAYPGGEAPGEVTVFSGDDGCTGSSTVAVRPTEDIEPVLPAGRRLSFTTGAGDRRYRVRIQNPGPDPVFLTVAASETTLFAASFSTNSTYDTYYSLQNTTSAFLSATLVLRTTSGALVGSFPISVPPGRTVGTNTVALAVPRNLVGTASLVHDGPPSSLLALAAVANFTSTPAYVQPVKFETLRDRR